MYVCICVFTLAFWPLSRVREKGKKVSALDVARINSVGIQALA